MAQEQPITPDDGRKRNQLGTNESMPVSSFAGSQLFQQAQGQGTQLSPFVPVTTAFLGSCVYQGRVVAQPDSIRCFPAVTTGGGCPGFLNNGLRIQAWTGNAGTIFLGSGNPLSALNGFPLVPGQTEFFRIAFPENLCFTTATGLISSGVSGQGGGQNILYMGT